jgi:hypothetical protein
LASTARVADSWIAAIRADMRGVVGTAPWWQIRAVQPEPIVA